MLEKLELLRSANTNTNTWQIHMELLEKLELLRAQIQIQLLEKYIWNCLKSCNFWEVQIQIQLLDKYIWNCLKSWNFWECKYKYNYSTNTSGAAWKVVTSEKCIMRCRLRCLAASATFWSLHSAPNDTFLLCKQDFESKDKYIHILLKHVPYRLLFPQW